MMGEDFLSSLYAVLKTAGISVVHQSGLMKAVDTCLSSLSAPPFILSAFQDSDRLVFVILTVFMLEMTFWSCILFYMGCLERLNIFGLQRYAIRRTQSYPSNKVLFDCLKDVMLGHFIIRPTLLFCSYPYLQTLLDFQPVAPRLSTVLKQLLVCSQIDDFLFYWLHRLCHVGIFYKYIHKQHHEFKHTVAIAVEWAHPVEEIFVNTVPTLLGPLLLQCHVTVFWLYICLKLYQSIDAHSGFDLPFPLSPWTIKLLNMDCAPAHYFHHSANIGNYGGFTMFWDWLCGTNVKYDVAMMKKSNMKGN